MLVAALLKTENILVHVESDIPGPGGGSKAT
jgi:formiminotetrahydrofolate cyclodeaminase